MQEYKKDCRKIDNCTMKCCNYNTTVSNTSKLGLKNDIGFDRCFVSSHFNVKQFSTLMRAI